MCCLDSQILNNPQYARHCQVRTEDHPLSIQSGSVVVEDTRGGRGRSLAWKEIITAEFSFAAFLPCVLYSGAAPWGTLATLFSYTWDAKGGCALHLRCMHAKPLVTLLSYLQYLSSQASLACACQHWECAQTLVAASCLCRVLVELSKERQLAAVGEPDHSKAAAF